MSARRSIRGPAERAAENLFSFAAKPEEIAILPRGKVLVRLDDEGEWKRPFAGYEPSGGLFEVLVAPGTGGAAGRPSPPEA